ncbi:group II intron reverse transcriptase/maturase [Streptomyces sp. BE303]|uniref:group II intron reverse transcriptase/maturase n=1 Tax=Streptomyces sp. BE303 TaxID=3002528 RepID=UPI002E77B8D3|nr:group II intron reverse transcriptase/maturase [Streptomyces sp. BE303]MED7950398.1 group II intron reverse transcriptase/maturase [Streptomyces sp. BE303]
MNTGELDDVLFGAEIRVLGIQTKLHRWAMGDPHRRFDDLFNLVADPAFLLVAWARVRGNKGARTAGVDGQTAYYVEAVQGVEVFLDRLRSQLKDRSFRPVPVRERMIPKANGKLRRLGIPTVADRVVQASLKLVLEPIFEADFRPCSYGFRPNRRAHDAVAEMRLLASTSYEWVLEADIAACFDEISHTALMDRVRNRIGDKRVLTLVKAFLKAGILSEAGQLRDTDSGTPQGGILSPLLANVALTALDDHFAEQWKDRVERAKRRRHGLANIRLIRYADDFAIMVSGTRAHAEALLDEVAEVLSTLGLRLAPDKTRVVHIDDGLDFLGWRIQRHRKRGTSKYYVYTYPARKAVRSCAVKVKKICWQDVNLPLEALLHQLNPLLRGWTAYFKPGVSSLAFQYLRAFTWRQVFGWLRRKYRRTNWKDLRRQYCGGGWWPVDGKTTLFNPGSVRTTRYRYRGAAIPSPWPSTA